MYIISHIFSIFYTNGCTNLYICLLEHYLFIIPQLRLFFCALILYMITFFCEITIYGFNSISSHCYFVSVITTLAKSVRSTLGRIVCYVHCYECVTYTVWTVVEHPKRCAVHIIFFYSAPIISHHQYSTTDAAGQGQAGLLIHV